MDACHPVQVSAGYYHSLAVFRNGYVTGWGRDDYGQASSTINLSNVNSVAAGTYHSLALLNNGTVVGWGSDFSGAANGGNALTGVVKIGAGTNYSVALLSNGNITGWGDNTYNSAFGGNNLVGCGAEQCLLTGINWATVIPNSNKQIVMTKNSNITITRRNDSEDNKTINYYWGWEALNGFKYQNPNNEAGFTVWPAARTWDFSPPVKDPVLALYSVGNNGSTVNLTTSKPYSVVYNTPNVFNPLNLINDHTFGGTEGFGVITFTGTHDSITITPDASEYWTNYVWGISQCSGSADAGCLRLNSDNSCVIVFPLILDVPNNGLYNFYFNSIYSGNVYGINNSVSTWINNSFINTTIGNSNSLVQEALSLNSGINLVTLAYQYTAQPTGISIGFIPADAASSGINFYKPSDSVIGYYPNYSLTGIPIPLNLSGFTKGVVGMYYSSGNLTDTINQFTTGKLKNPEYTITSSEYVNFVQTGMISNLPCLSSFSGCSGCVCNNDVNTKPLPVLCGNNLFSAVFPMVVKAPSGGDYQVNLNPFDQSVNELNELPYPLDDNVSIYKNGSLVQTFGLGAPPTMSLPLDSGDNFVTAVYNNTYPIGATFSFRPVDTGVKFYFPDFRDCIGKRVSELTGMSSNGLNHGIVFLAYSDQHVYDNIVNGGSIPAPDGVGYDPGGRIDYSSANNITSWPQPAAATTTCGTVVLPPSGDPPPPGNTFSCYDMGLCDYGTGPAILFSKIICNPNGCYTMIKRCYECLYPVRGS